MVYLSAFYFPGEDREWEYRKNLKERIDDSIYPFYVLPEKGISEIYFAPLTILYGGNGSGKSTVLNVIAEKLFLKRDTPFNRTRHFEPFVNMCNASQDEEIPASSRIVTSDDVFDFMLDLRAINQGVENKRSELKDEFYSLRENRNGFQLRGLDDYDELKKMVEARRRTRSSFVREYAGKTAREHSNGESAEIYFHDKIRDDTLCLLDEPENSLSPLNQMKLAEYLTESVRYCGVQLIISTHSPFLLAMEGARIIDMDHGGKVTEEWWKLENVRAYYDFFEKNKSKFK